jgi:hypothetical protein
MLRWWCWVTLGALMLFVAAMFAAAELYPGGSWTDPGAQGFSWLRNFWCDLLRSRAINGADNGLGKQLASIGFAALGAALWPYWWVAASVLTAKRKRSVTLLGMVSAACLGAMAFLPSDRYPVLHGVVALGGGLLGIACAWVCVATRLPREPRSSLRRASGVAALGLAVLNATLYVYVAYGGGDETVAQPFVQKLATAALLVWMLSTVREAQRRSAVM